MTRNILHQYPTRLKRDGVGKEEIEILYKQIEETLDSINVPDDDYDKAYIMKRNITNMLEDTKNSVDAAYGTTKGGDS
jgi:tRNA C32,U32 (ribose-2'-O)-methylase TrmJ